MSRDSDAKAVVSKLNGLLDDLRANVDTLNAILTRPADHGGEDDERLISGD